MIDRKLTRRFLKLMGCGCLLTSIMSTTQWSNGATNSTVSVAAAMVAMPQCDDGFCVLRTPFPNKAGIMVCSAVALGEPAGNNACDATSWCWTPACVFDASTTGCSCWGQGW